jgi:acetoin utilization deacetylase AcuC-like enzyme
MFVFSGLRLEKTSGYHKLDRIRNEEAIVEELVLFYPEGHDAHFEQGHPERPERVEIIRQAFIEAGWWENFRKLNPLILSDQVLQAVHELKYLTLLQSACRMSQRLDADTYTTPSSWELALQAAGGAASVAGAVWTRRARRGFALTRPPGHHATRSRGMGFCLLNNIAIAAEYLIQEYQAQRLAIIDLDLHHGNGTQDIFYHRGDVFYFSTHQSPLYPGTGSVYERGAGSGHGTNTNIPLPPGSGDEGLEQSLQRVILPLLDRYMPEMLLISYGFDIHWRDPLGYLMASAAGYGNMIARLASWADKNCDGRIALFLEGGYDLDAGAACSLSSIAALIDVEWEDYLGPSPQAGTENWQTVLGEICEVWELE